MTNGDKIRSMSDEELAKLLNKSACDYCNGCCSVYPSCESAIESWLERDVKAVVFV